MGLSGMAGLMTATAAMALLLLLVRAPTAAADDLVEARRLGALEISDYWARATRPGDQATTGYMVIRNTGEHMDCLIAASTPLTIWTEIHQRIEIDEAAELISLRDGIDIPPGGSISFSPGGNHLMFMDVEAAFQVGSMAAVNLTFERAGRITLYFPIRQMPGKLDHSEAGEIVVRHDH